VQSSAQELFKLFATAPKGLEPLLAEELQHLDAAAVNGCGVG